MGSPVRRRSSWRKRRNLCRAPRKNVVPRGRILRCKRERSFDDEFALRTRNQHRRAHSQRQGPELSLAGQIGERLTLDATLQQRVKMRDRDGIEASFRVRMQVAARPVQHVREQ